MGLKKKKIAEENDTTPPHPPTSTPTPTPEALRVTYQEQEDISQWEVRRGRDVISGRQFKRLFSRSLQLLIWVINLHCAALMCHVTADTCCFKWRLKVSYSLGHFHPVSVIHFSYFFFSLPSWHPFVTSRRDAKGTGHWHQLVGTFIEFSFFFVFFYFINFPARRPPCGKTDWSGVWNERWESEISVWDL